jgi:hypothetical protein
MGGATSGKFAVKSCGKAHAWCAVCRPDMAERQRKGKPPRKTDVPPCRNCGTCDRCLGLVAPDGMKICRQCGETKLLSAFHKRKNTGTYRNQCNKCMAGPAKSAKCEGCGRRFTRHPDGTTLCSGCRAVMAKSCARCGASFTGTLYLRSYCSDECRDAAFKEKRQVVRLAQRLEALRAYSDGDPACVCCGESILLFLALDHVNGGGHKQRKDTGGGGFYVWLRKNGYPEGFRILCHNCNFGRQLNGGICPHLAA